MVISSAKESQILSLYAVGRPVSTIARTTSLSDYKVKKLLVKNGVFRHKEDVPKASSLDWEQAVEWYHSGVSRQEIAKRLNVSISTVGVQFRKRHVNVCSRNRFLSKRSPHIGEILRMLRKGLSLARIAQLLKCPRVSVDKAYWAFCRENR